eukprot:Skav207995  [mRNA]  locus=scaffold1203:146712:153141:- [translate_table: standard]
MGACHLPQPTVHLGLSMMGASHSPSSSSSQSSGLLDLGSAIFSGSSSSHPAGMEAAGSSMRAGASSSQSSGLKASGSSILASSTQSAGLLSLGSSISLGGFTGGVRSFSKEPLNFWSPSTCTSMELSGRNSTL